MRLTVLNLKNAIATNYALKDAAMQTQIIRNQRSLINSANVVGKSVALSYDVSNDKLKYNVRLTSNLDRNRIFNLNLLHRKCSKIFSNIIRIYQTNVRLILMFLHINHITILLQNHLFKVKFLTRDTNFLHMIIEKDVISL